MVLQILLLTWLRPSETTIQSLNTHFVQQNTINLFLGSAFPLPRMLSTIVIYCQFHLIIQTLTDYTMARDPITLCFVE